MKKTMMIASIATLLNVATTAEAAFTAMSDGDYTMYITGGCFQLSGGGTNCQASGTGTLTDNTTSNQATLSGFGSGIINDGYMGVIDFSMAGGNISVTSFSQDSYLDTVGGTFYIRATDVANMSGTIDSLGNMNFDPTGRTAIASAFASSIGEQEWNRDNASSGQGSGLYRQWTTDTSTSRTQGIGKAFTMTGSALLDSSPGKWTGTLVSAGNTGSAWGLFDNAQYSELYNVKIVSAVPIPAAVWLFGSGLLALLSISNRRKLN